MKTKAAIAINALQGKLASLFGYFFGVIMLMAFVGFVMDLGDTEVAFDLGMAVITMLLLAGCVFLVVKGIQIKRRIKRYRYYVSLLSTQNIHSVDIIAQKSGHTCEFVVEDIRILIKKSFFINAYIDEAANEIIIGGDTERCAATPEAQKKVVVCNGCGANTFTIVGQITQCEYCGSYLE